MAALHQIGHQSDNLINNPQLTGFSGAILSPINYTEPQVQTQVARFQNSQFHCIFDPQLYFPQTEDEKLRGWSYFPSDVGTADTSSTNWWGNIINRLTDCITRFGPTAVCSPSIVARSYSPDYYQLSGWVANELMYRCQPLGIQVIQTILARLDDLQSIEYVSAIASVITSQNISNAMVVFISNQNPRLELAESDLLTGAMYLIYLLVRNGIHVTVSFSSTDLLLWKEAGAHDVATGKFFNLRRFTSSRWDDNDGGGGQKPYWVEESLLAYLEETDLKRAQKMKLLSSRTLNNPFSSEIFVAISKGTPWLRYSWCHYLYWFSEIEKVLTENPGISLELIKLADQNWSKADELHLIPVDRTNRGAWISEWLRAIYDFRKLIE